MSDSEDRRLTDASDLHAQIHALRSVPPNERKKILLKRIEQAVSDICKKTDGGRAPFNNAQVETLTDIVFHIIYLLDPKHTDEKRFTRAVWREFREQSPFKQVAIAAGVLVVIVGASWNLFQFLTSRPTVLQPAIAVPRVATPAEPRAPSPGATPQGSSRP